VTAILRNRSVSGSHSGTSGVLNEQQQPWDVLYRKVDIDVPGHDRRTAPWRLRLVGRRPPSPIAPAYCYASAAASRMPAGVIGRRVHATGTTRRYGNESVRVTPFLAR
jgi:hypothetical protein